MNFTFLTQQIDTAAPVLGRQPTRLRWRDTDQDTIDAWLVKRYEGTFADPFLNEREQFYVSGYGTSNIASIDLQDFLDVNTFDLSAYQFISGLTQATRPTAQALIGSYVNLDSAFKIFSVTGGVVSAELGSFVYRPIRDGKVQRPDQGTFIIPEYYPDDATKQGFLTNRPVSTDHTRYVMAKEDEAVVSLLQLENLDYAYETGKNLNNCDWDRVYYGAYLNGALVASHTLSLSTAPMQWYGAPQDIPLGPYNMRDFVWAIDPTFDTQTSDWDYIQIQPGESGGGGYNALPIRVFKDCRPIKHHPAQLMFINDLGSPEYLRFNGRVVEQLDVGDRMTYEVHEGEESYGGPFYLALPQRIVGKSKGRQSLALSEDFFTDTERELFKQALTSRQCMVRFKGEWTACFVSTSIYNHEESASRLLPIRCEVQFLYDLLC